MEGVASRAGKPGLEEPVWAGWEQSSRGRGGRADARGPCDMRQGGPRTDSGSARGSERLGCMCVISCLLFKNRGKIHISMLLALLAFQENLDLQVFFPSWQNLHDVEVTTLIIFRHRVQEY